MHLIETVVNIDQYNACSVTKSNLPLMTYMEKLGIGMRKPGTQVLNKMFEIICMNLESIDELEYSTWFQDLL